MKILFITSNRLGDAVLSTGILDWLGKQHPGAQFTIACGPYAAGLFRATPGLERLIVICKQSWNRHWLQVWRETAATRWDLIVDIRNSVVSRLIRADKRCYGGKHRGGHKVAELAGIIGASPPPAPCVWLDASAEAEAGRLLPQDRTILAFGPGANWACKQWPPEHFAALAQQLIAPGGALAGAAVLIAADEKERATIAPLLSAIPDADRIELFGRALPTVASCFKRARLFVGNDSGLMHLAAAAGTPTLGLFGPGYPETYGPWGKHSAVALTVETREELLAQLERSPNKKINLMRSLSVERAADAARALLAKT